MHSSESFVPIQKAHPWHLLSAIFEENTIVGPNYDISDGAMSILDVILPEDLEGTEYRTGFEEIATAMVRGETGNATFIRTNDESEETFFIAYTGVNLRILRPLDHRDFATANSISSKLVYSLGIAISESDLYLRYETVERQIERQLDITRGVSIAAMVIMAFLFTVLTYYISMNIIRPIIALTKIVKSIKNNSLREDIPDVEGGSKEVSFVHESFQRLMKVVRFANTAFFAGDRTQSYHSMEDALNLFMKLGNQKVSCVGMMLAMIALVQL